MGAFSGGGGGGGGSSSSVSPAQLSTIADAAVGAQFSDGLDGNCDLDGVNQVPFATLAGSVYTATREPLPNNLRIRDGIVLDMAGQRGPYCRGILQIDADAGSGGGILRQVTNDASGATAGAAKAAVALSATLAGGAGGAAGGAAAGGGGASGGAPWPIVSAWTGGTGGASSLGAGASGGNPTSTSATRGSKRGGAALSIGQAVATAGLANYTYGAGGGGGRGSAGAAGGGGGAGGWQIRMAAARVYNHGSIQCRGGNGAAGLGVDCGGGGGGGGGDVDIVCGTYYGNDPDVRGGDGGASGGTTGRPGDTGMDGQFSIHQLSVLAPNPAVALTAGELAAAIVAGVLDVSGTFQAPSGMAANLGAFGNASGSGDFNIFEGTTADGALKLRYDGATNQIRLYVRGVNVLTTDTSNPAAPTFQSWRQGNLVDWRIWYDPAGGARSMGIRISLRGCLGHDKTGAGSGSALAALSSASAHGYNDTSWSVYPGHETYLNAPKSANVPARGIMLGDSIVAPRAKEPALGSLLGSSGVVISLAQGGALVADQLATWQASQYRTANPVWVYIQIGVNDVAAGTAAATILAGIQALVDDIAANSPSSKIIIGCITPCATYLSAAQDLVRIDVNTGIMGGGGSPITGVDARVDGYLTTMAAAGGALRNQLDQLHDNFAGRVKNAAPVALGIVASGVAV
jgi:hypothetical protein